MKREKLQKKKLVLITPNDTTGSVPYKHGTLRNIGDCHPGVAKNFIVCLC